MMHCTQCTHTITKGILCIRGFHASACTLTHIIIDLYDHSDLASTKGLYKIHIAGVYGLADCMHAISVQFNSLGQWFVSTARTEETDHMNTL